MKPHISITAVLCAFFLTGCATLKNLGSFQRPRLVFVSWMAQDIDFEGATIVLTYRVENTNSIGVSVAGARYQLEVEARRILSGSLPGGLEIPARGSAPLVVTVRFLWTSLPTLFGLITTRDSLKCRVSGSVDVNTPIGRIEIPFEHTDRVSVPRRGLFGQR
jgi:LEA14-like dessication related protein